MSEQDVRDAAERLRRAFDEDEHSPLLQPEEDDWIRNDVLLLASEHPADGAEAIDAEFWEQQGFIAGSTSSFLHMRFPWYAKAVDGVWEIILLDGDNERIATLATRADARAWFRLAGVELKE